MSYSIDFRRPVLMIKAKENLTFDEIAERFDVGRARVVRWSKRIPAQRTRNPPATKIHRETLKQDVEQYHYAYQYEPAKRFEVSQTGIG